MKIDVELTINLSDFDAQIAEARAEAKAEGYSEGFQAGYTEGNAHGWADGREAAGGASRATGPQGVAA